MIQRIQSLYLLLVLMIYCGVGSFFTLVKNYSDETYSIPGIFVENSWELNSIIFVLIISSILSLLALLKFNNRILQIILNRFNIISNLYLLGIFVYQLLSLSGEIEISKKGIWLFLPFVVIVLLVLANRSIRKDEELVKSVDRLR